MGQEQLEQKEKVKVSEINDALKGLRAKQGDTKNYGDDFYVYLKKTNPNYFKMLMQMNLKDKDKPPSDEQLISAWHMLSVFLKHQALYNKPKEDKDVSDLKELFEDDKDVNVEGPNEITYGDVKIEKGSNGRWYIDNNSDLNYSDVYTAVGDAKMIEEAINTMSKTPIAKDHLQGPFEVNLVGNIEMHTDTWKRDVEISRSKRALFGDNPSTQMIVDYLNTMQSAKAIPEIQSTNDKAEVKQTLDDLNAYGLTFTSKVVSEQEIQIFSKGREAVKIVRGAATSAEGVEGVDWKIEGSDIKKDDLGDAVKLAVEVQKIEAIFVERDRPALEGKKGPYDEALVKNSMGWLFTSEENVKNVTDLLNDRWKAKKDFVETIEKGATDVAERDEIGKLFKSMDALNVDYPEFNIDIKNANELVIGNLSEDVGSIVISRIDGTKWQIAEKESLTYTDVEEAVKDAMLVLKIEAAALNLEGDESISFSANFGGGEISIEADGKSITDFDRGYGLSRGVFNGVSTEDLVTYMNEKWVKEMAPTEEAIPTVDTESSLENTITQDQIDDGWDGEGTFTTEGRISKGTWENSELVNGWVQYKDGTFLAGDFEDGYLVKGIYTSADKLTHESGTFTKDNQNSLITGTRIYKGSMVNVINGKPGLSGGAEGDPVIEKHDEGTFTVGLGDKETSTKIQNVVRDPEATPAAKSNRKGNEGKTYIYDKEKGSYYAPDGTRLKIYNGDKITLGKDERTAEEKEKEKEKEAIRGEYALTETTDGSYNLSNKNNKEKWEFDAGSLRSFVSMENVKEIVSGFDENQKSYKYDDVKKAFLDDKGQKLVFTQDNHAFHMVKSSPVMKKVETVEVAEIETSTANLELLARLQAYKEKGYKEIGGMKRDDFVSEIDKALIGKEFNEADGIALNTYEAKLKSVDAKVEDSNRADTMSLAWEKSYEHALRFVKDSDLKVGLSVVSRGLHENNKVVKVTVGEGAEAKTAEIKVVTPILGKVEAYDKANGVRINYKGTRYDDLSAAVEAAAGDLSKPKA